MQQHQNHYKSNNHDHISVCIPTYKRPKMLTRLLNELQHQITNDLFTYSIVIVDNDHDRSAESTVATFKEASLIGITYYNEPEQNIALARNKAVENAKGDLLAFIDDDELPLSNWLLTLYKAYRNFNADGILGPVKPHFDQKPPDWLVKGKFCERDSYRTGTVLSWNHTRTGNVLFDKTIFNDEANRFRAEFGLTGGEDIEFFKKMIGKGMVFVWCNEAAVYEKVPQERWKKSFYLKKVLRIGGLTGEKTRKGTLGAYRDSIKVIISFILYTSALPISLLFGEHVRMKCLIKVVYNFGWFSGFVGHVVIRYRND